jgi:hypothetical protein
MDEYRDLANLQKEIRTGGGELPSVGHLLGVKIVENAGAIGLASLVLFVGAVLFYVGMKESDATKSQWALNGASLCLGAIIGLITGRSGKRD